MPLPRLREEESADLQKMVIRYPFRESGPGGCVGKGSGTEEMKTLKVLNLKWEFQGWKMAKGVVIL